MWQIKTVVGLMIASATFLAAQADPPSRVGRLNYTEGLVSFQPAGVDDWVDATVNRPLIPGDNIWVGDQARAELHVGSAALRLDENTAFQFLSLDDDVVQIRLSEGLLTVRVRSMAQSQVFEIDTPNLAFTVLRPGEYRIEVNPDSQATMVTVRNGEGDVTGGGEQFPIRSLQRAVVNGFDQIAYKFSAAPPDDAWDRWNASRDRREDQSQSARYVSREMIGYEDLDQYGRWAPQPGYGQVWMPTTVAVGWSPYHYGHWAWIAPWGWTWVDDAPWGFAPYHYGRWASFGGRWGWIPGPYGVAPIYAPALVAWVGGGRGGSGFSLSFSIGTAPAVGWFPLGPREPYFPSYRASQGYFTRVNTTNTVINNTTINNYYDYSRNSNNTAVTNIRYANQQVQNGVTAVPQDAFARGRQVNQVGRSVPVNQLGNAQVYGSPAIAPQREGVLGARRENSRAARPPENVINRPVVARRAPAPAAVPFDRQQSALSQTPGRALPAATEQQVRQGAPVPNASVRVVDANRVRRVQPSVDNGQKGAAKQNSAAPPAGIDQPNTRQGRPQAQPEVAQPPAIDRQKGSRRQPQVSQPAERPQPPAASRQASPQVPQQPRQDAVRPQPDRSQVPVTRPQAEKGKGNRRQ
ncbi:MAG: DUF6600 domain-containing protein [Acidobacteriota bacterium]